MDLFSHNYEVIENYYRKSHYTYFSRYDNPFYNLTIHLHIERLYAFIKENDYSLYTNLCYIFTKSISAIDDFRYRKINNDIVLYDSLHLRMTVPFKKYWATYSIARVPVLDDIHEFNTIAVKIISDSKEELYLDEEREHKNFVYYSSLPNLQFTHLTHLPEPDSDDAAPKITFGRFHKRNQERVIPVSLQINHRFIDGQHVQAAVEEIQDNLNSV